MKRVGFIGVGTMGTPMVTNLLKAGFSVVAYDVKPEALDEAGRRGAAVAGSAAEVAQDSDIVVTMLPSATEVEACYCGQAGVLAGAPPGRLCVDMVAKAASSHDYAPGFMTDLMAKVMAQDLGLAVMAGREQRVPLFTASAALQLYRLASAQGLGRKDFSSVYSLLKPSSESAPV